MNIVGVLLFAIHVVICISLILIVLLQAGKGASLGAALGGGSSQTVFGSGSATFIGRITWVMFAAFLLTSLLLTKISPYGDNGTTSGAAGLQTVTDTAPPLGTPPATELPGATPGLDQDLSGELGGDLTPAAPSPEAEDHTGHDHD
jgi:preprotein translocase subunit SecG